MLLKLATYKSRLICFRGGKEEIVADILIHLDVSL